jgi:transposase
LARLLWSGELDAVSVPDELTRVLRRRLARREQLMRARTRTKNDVHAVLVRQLVGRPPFSDLFGVKGRQWLRQLELPVEECETIEACMRHVAFLDAEISEVERLIARYALSCSDARRLMSVPGVNVIGAATFLAAIGDVRRFKTSRQLVGYLGLDPKVRQSGSSPARGGRISSRAPRRHRRRWSKPRSVPCASPALCNAFYERIRARRGHGIATVAAFARSPLAQAQSNLFRPKPRDLGTQQGHDFLRRPSPHDGTAIVGRCVIPSTDVTAGTMVVGDFAVGATFVSSAMVSTY